jgi:cobalamin biosynthesis protein CobW
MKKLIDRPDPPDHIVIETSGLALPQPLVRAFNWPEVKSRVTVDGVVTVVDTKALSEGRFADDEEAIAAQRAADPNVEHENPIEELFEDQLNCADMVILNKTDLLDTDELASLSRDMRGKVRRGTRLVPAKNGALDVPALLGVKAAAEDDMNNRLSHHEMEGEVQHDHDDFVTFAVSLEGTLEKKTLEGRIEKVLAGHDVLRLKGFANVEGSAARLLIQAVGPRLDSYFDRPWKRDEPRGTNLVVIAMKGVDKTAIEAALKG